MGHRGVYPFLREASGRLNSAQPYICGPESPGDPGIEAEHSPQYLKAYRGRSASDLTAGRQTTGLLIDAEVYDAVGVLIRSEEELSSGVDDKVPRRPSSGRFMTNIGQFAGPAVDGVDDDAVVAPVRPEEKPS